MTQARGIAEALADVVVQTPAEALLDRANRRNELLASVASRLLGSEEPQRIVNDLCQDVLGFLDCHAFFNYLVDEQQQRLHLNTCGGIPQETARSIEWLDFGVAVCGCAARDGCRIVAENIPTTADPRTELVKSFGIKAYACHPLRSQGRLIGTLSFGTRTRTTFSEDDLALMKAVADQIAIAMSRIRDRDELRRARDAAEDANRIKDQFLAALSHELRTPLNPVYTAAQMMTGHPNLPAEFRENVALIRRNVELEIKLIDDLLDLTRIARSKLELRPEAMDFHEKIRQVIEICQPEIQNKKLALSLSFAAARRQVKADSARLQQVLWNLLKNAVKFTPPGGRVEVRTEDRDGCIALVVRDTGVGIDPAVLPKLFNAFEQGSRDVTRQFGGLGLGLAISKSIIDLHGGKLSAHSEGKGKGATFTLELPTAAAPEQRPRNGHPLKIGDGARNLRVLLVEDHADTARIMSRLLKGYGMEVRTAGNVQQAIEAARQERFELLLSDIGLPDGTGHDVIRQINLLYPIRGIAISGYGMDEDIQRSREAGFIAHLTKPLDLRKLEETLRQVVQAVPV